MIPPLMKLFMLHAPLLQQATQRGVPLRVECLFDPSSHEGSCALTNLMCQHAVRCGKLSISIRLASSNPAVRTMGLSAARNEARREDGSRRYTEIVGKYALRSVGVDL
jgi:hypothetical protein